MPKSNATKEPIVLTGRTWVSGALANIFESRGLVQRNVQKGDMKLWCHLRKGARVWSGQFRAAVYDGRGWRTFRLNIVADDDVRYDSFDERTSKARRCFDAVARLKGQTARWFDKTTTYGCTFTLKAEGDIVRRDTTGSGVTAAAVHTTQASAAPLAAARTALPPAVGTEPKTSSSPPSRGRRGRKAASDDRQLTLF